MKLTVINLSGKQVGTMTASDEVFDVPMNPSLLAQALHVYRTNERQRPAKVLTRGDVYGSRRKLWKQKGTGRARHGDRFAPQFVGGGVAHGPTGHENFHRTMSQTMRRAALFVALSRQQRVGQLTVIESFGSHTKTKTIATLLSQWTDRPLLCVAEDILQPMSRAVRNLDGIVFMTPTMLNAQAVLSARHVIVSRAAVERIASHFLGAGGQT